MSVHSCSLGAPILLEEMKAAGTRLPVRPQGETPACDKLRAGGQWNTAADPFFAVDPEWTDAFMAAGIGIYGSGVMPPKELELLSVALDASFTPMYAPGTRRHIRAALGAGATAEEIMEVLKLCVVPGVQSLQACRPAISVCRSLPKNLPPVPDGRALAEENVMPDFDDGTTAHSSVVKGHETGRSLNRNWRTRQRGWA